MATSSTNPYGSYGNGLGVLAPQSNPFTTAIADAGNQPNGPYSPAVYNAAANPNTSQYLVGQKTPVEGAYTGDPYAAWGGTAAYNAKVNGLNAQEDTTMSTANQAVNNFGSEYGNRILNWLSGQTSGQKTIDNQAQKNQLAKMQGVNGILSMVGQGIQSGGVTLANRNAGDSSGAEAIARAYGQLGNQQMANVGNQYQLGQTDVQNSQDEFNSQQQLGLKNLDFEKQKGINNIVTSANQQLAAIQADRAAASLPQRLQLDQAEQQIRSQAVQALQQYDQQLSGGVGAIKPMGQDQVRAGAATMASAGYDLGNNAFNYTTEAPAQFQNTGPSPSALPVYSNQYGKKQTA